MIISPASAETHFLVRRSAATRWAHLTDDVTSSFVLIPAAPRDGSGSQAMEFIEKTMLGATSAMPVAA
jgi:hypothetical protein